MFQVKIVLGVFLMLAAYCVGCGQIDLWPGWWYAGFFLVTFTGSYLVLTRIAPDIVVERVTWHAGVMQWDKPIVTWLMLGPMVACLVAGLDARRNGIDPTKSKIFLGYVLAIAGSALTLAAMTANRFYTPVVRIQSERGHKVAESGPYRVVRHPGNLGNVVLNVATPLMLASHWAWIPAGLSILLIILRTTMEDRMLRLELPDIGSLLSGRGVGCCLGFGNGESGNWTALSGLGSKWKLN
jgi:protein-S-isoprenylcysteine O-methyltransferase Ste14